MAQLLIAILTLKTLLNSVTHFCALTLNRPGFFRSCGTGGGGGRIPPPPLKSENIKAMTPKLKGQIARPKMFPLRSATSADYVI